ncbi:hypothetical protein KGV55_00795 [Candidatus Gracilibacteria bacterium]|nr:hypothetical protein [Candidatus Gracilibacteria bacterium]
MSHRTIEERVRAKTIDLQQQFKKAVLTVYSYKDADLRKLNQAYDEGKFSAVVLKTCILSHTVKALFSS